MGNCLLPNGLKVALRLMPNDYFCIVLKLLPNAMTLGNLFCGCLAVVSIFHGQVNHAAAFVAFAAILDFLDGFVARKLNVQSEMGKQLDSLADMVTFGLVPGVVLFHLMLQSNYFAIYESRMAFRFFKYFMFVVTLFSCLRLAKFNIDTRQKEYFIGLPTPANTLMILSFALIVFHNQFGLRPYILNPWTLAGIASLSAGLLVSTIPMISFKLTGKGVRENKAQIILLATAVILLPLLKFAALPIIITVYILLSLIYPPEKKQI